MTEDFVTYLILCPVAALAGFIDAIAGGGGLISLPAFLATGLPVHACLGTNKLAASMGTVLTLNRFVRAGYLPERHLILLAILFSALGATCGASLTLLFSDLFLKWVLLLLLPLSAAYVLKSKAQSAVERPRLQGRSEYLRVTGIALLMGLYCGFYGPASGTFLMLLLFALAKMPITEANCTTKIINLTTNLAAIAVFLRNDDVLIGLGLSVGLFNMLGCYFGARYFVKKNYSGAKYIIALVLTICFVKILWDLL